MNWRSARTEEPSFDHVNYLVVLKVDNHYIYGSAYWDSEKWIYTSVKDAEVIAFTETDPKSIACMVEDPRDTMLDTFLRLFSRKYQKEGEWAERYGTHFESDKVVMRPYCWCEKETCPYCFDLEGGIVTEELKSKYGMEDNRTAPNFWYKPLDFKVWWYKYMGRSVKVNKRLSEEEFKKMFDDCIVTSRRLF